MSTEPEATGPNGIPLPPGIKLRTRKFGTNPVSPLVAVPVGGSQGDSSAPPSEFAIHWEDRQQGLTVLMRQRENGRLAAEVFCANADLLNKAWVSVGLGGTSGNLPLCKTIPLKVPEKGGCSGSADFGPLEDAVKELGPQLAVVVFLLL